MYISMFFLSQFYCLFNNIKIFQEICRHKSIIRSIVDIENK